MGGLFRIHDYRFHLVSNSLGCDRTGVKTGKTVDADIVESCRHSGVSLSTLSFGFSLIHSDVGGGKTTQVRILAGELEPTAGEVIKSAKNLRVSFLRQEFIDGLVMERSLKDELTSVFTEEAKILSDLQACEVGDISMCAVI